MSALDSPPLEGLVAATFTPFDAGGSVDLSLIPAVVDFLARNGVSGIYICGSTGEGPSLTMEERQEVTKSYIDAAKGRLTTVVHIGHTVLKDCQKLGAHAAACGADAISAVSPYYFKPVPLEALVEFMREAALSAEKLPFYYYHIPALTGMPIDPVAFLERGMDRIPNLRGMKYTDADLSTFSACQSLGDSRLDLLFGRDEMLLSGLAAGARGFVGSTYNLAPGLYRSILQAFEEGDLEKARSFQSKSISMIRAIVSVGGESAIKYPMHRHGLDCGQRRLPMKQLSEADRNEIDRRLDEIGFDDWSTAKGN